MSIADATSLTAGALADANRTGLAELTRRSPLLFNSVQIGWISVRETFLHRHSQIDIAKKTFPHTHSQAPKYRASYFEIETTVALNRVRAQKKFYGLTIEEVCLKRQQFSCWNAGEENLPKIKKVTPADPVFVECLAIASDAVMDRLTPPDPTSGAKHYHADPINKRPKWSAGKEPSARIGKHVFFNNID